MTQLTIEYIPLDELIRWPRNPKQHDLGVIHKSMERFGFTSPVLVDENSGRLVAGHGRLDTLMQKMNAGEDPPARIIKNGKMWKIPVVRGLSFESEQEAEAYLLADNRLVELGGWDELQLAEVLSDLARDGRELLEGTGYDGDDLDRLLSEYGEKEGLTDDDAIPEVPEMPKTKTGDLYILGDHRLLCGDATKKEDVERLMDGQKADMVFTDPPYGVDYDGGVMTPRKKLKGDDSTDLYMPCCKYAFKFSAEDAPIYLWHAGVKGIAAAAAAAAAAAGYIIRCEIVWNKNQAQYGALSAQYKQKHEPCYYCFKKGKTVNWCGPTTEVTVWDLDRASKNEYHPTQKPVGLAERAIGNHKAESVLDLFGGSGSTLIACEKTNRKCYMMEIDPHYCDVIVERFENYTGKQADLLT